MDAGTFEGAPEDDLDGRPRGVAVDIGAYEYSPATVFLDTPPAGILLEVGDQYTISWHGLDQSGPVTFHYSSLEVSTDGGTSWQKIAIPEHADPAT